MSDENACFTSLIERVYRGAFVSEYWPAVLLAGPQAEIVFANPSALTLLAGADGLSLRELPGPNRWQLLASHAATQAEIDAALRLALDAADADGVFAKLIVVPRPSRRPAYVLRCAALAQANAFGAFGDADMPRAILFITDTAQPLALDAEALTRLFGLTVSEARLAVVLGEGIGLKQAADMLDVSLNTVKTQLQQVYLKSGVASRARLMKLLAALSRGGV